MFIAKFYKVILGAVGMTMVSFPAAFSIQLFFIKDVSLMTMVITFYNGDTDRDSN